MLRAVLWPTLAVVALLALLVGSVLHLSTAGADSVAVRRQTHLVTVALQRELSDLGNDQEASTYWDDAVLRVRERPLDLDWMDQNLGIWFHEYYGHDETYILDPGDRPIYAMRGGKRVDPSEYEGINPAGRVAAADLRNLMKRSGDGVAGLTPAAIGYTIVRGRPAMLSVKPILSESGKIDQPRGSEHLHISIRYLDGSLLTELSSAYGIGGLAYSRDRQGDSSLPIVSPTGRQVGYLNWQPFRPGQTVAQRIAPLLLVVLALLGMGLAWLLARVLRGRLELEASRAQAQHLAFHDPMTALPNRALFAERLNRALATVEPGRTVALILLDLDRFKHVNDTLGHLAGDALITQFGRRLTALVGPTDTVSRLGGDEFAILLEGVGSREDVDRLCRDVIAAVREPFNVLGSEVHAAVSMGAVFADDKADDRNELLRKADIALHCAKEEGRGCYRFFSPDMDAGIQLRSAMEDDLRKALDGDGQLFVHYQPQYAATGRALVGVEALVRWEHPLLGPVAPEHFIPIAEATGLIRQLDEWVMREACIASHRWPHLTVAVNLSPVHFRSRALPERLKAIVREAGTECRRIQIELTETILLGDYQLVQAILTDLRAAGFTLALDDFGTGYSSLSYLHNFRVDKIKIDRSFVQAIGRSVDAAAIVGAILALGRAMKLSVTAEGVETVDQRQFLEAAGCTEMQGFLFGPALPPESIDDIVLPRALTA